MSIVSGVICLIMSGNCPIGWTQYNSINDDETGIYLRANTSLNLVKAGTNSHSHSGPGSHTHSTVSPTTGYDYDPSGASYGGDYIVDGYSPAHLHGAGAGYSGSSSGPASSSTSHAPSRTKFMLCRKD